MKTHEPTKLQYVCWVYCNVYYTRLKIMYNHFCYNYLLNYEANKIFTEMELCSVKF